MKNKFPEFYDTQDSEELWKTCHFIFDTNIFINLYKKYPKTTCEQFMNTLEEKIPDRIWMPYQIGLEYQKNRIKQVKDKEHDFNDTMGIVKGINNALKSNFQKPVNQIEDKCRFIDFSNYLDLDLINKKFEEICSLTDEINASINENIDFLDNDEIRKKLDNLYEGKVGDGYPFSRLKEIHEEGEYRYAAKIPPGFEDRNKKSGDPYGDLILWHQIMDHAENDGIPIIFVTNEEKKDWWLNYKINKNTECIIPHPHLINEFASTGQEFHMCKLGEFLNKSKEYFDADIEDETIETVDKIEELRELEEEFEELENNEGVKSLPPESAITVISEANKGKEIIKEAFSSGSGYDSAAQEAIRHKTVISAVLGYQGTSLVEQLTKMNTGTSLAEQLTKMPITGVYPIAKKSSEYSKKKKKRNNTETNESKETVNHDDESS